ncbi:hypothetical protein D3C71_1884270 [compost metagenome]
MRKENPFETEKIAVAQGLVQCAARHLALCGVSPGGSVGQAAVHGPGRLVLGAAGCHALYAN